MDKQIKAMSMHIAAPQKQIPAHVNTTYALTRLIDSSSFVHCQCVTQLINVHLSACTYGMSSATDSSLLAAAGRTTGHTQLRVQRHFWILPHLCPRMAHVKSIPLCTPALTPHYLVHTFDSAFCSHSSSSLPMQQEAAVISLCMLMSCAD